MFGIGEAARRSGLSIETIRYYEREGFAPPPGRTASGRRAYSAREVAALAFLKRCRDLGFPLADAVALRDLATGAEAPCAEVEAIGCGQLAEVRRKIAELQALEQALAELVGNCAGGQAACPMLDRLRQEAGVTSPAR
ncbi:Mercuric resistance operon regulatory protein [Pseudoruegeria aquimaris]|uniref:Mercuric resistance operon regulatory protein n=1 Tax=Pseudoruegeria aquimaris TaxID=393663 RepID=A0A1Y5TG93_9RHOB|nr:MerR family transcriptional regulator [Pseudoruegeria aquimaris]SLN63388.1 Mercuric resistance operon regulatory protein [Pseudoruegeria aquimaris]